MNKEIWAVRDSREEEFTDKLLDEVHEFSKLLGHENIIVEISKKSITKLEPHYHIKVNFGFNFASYGMSLTLPYTTASGSEDDVGELKIHVSAYLRNEHKRVLASAVFGLYSSAFRKFYPELVTSYNIQNYDYEYE